jgi:hypothetical protein
MNETKPKRRWFRFSLRTLLVAVTLLCIWLGWQARIVQERKGLLELLTQSGGHAADMSALSGPVFKGTTLKINVGLGPGFKSKAVEIHPNQANLASYIRHLFGDREIGLISLPDQLVKDREQFVSVFPDATVMMVNELNSPANTFDIPALRNQMNHQN